MLRDEASLLDIYKAGNKIVAFAEGFSAKDIAEDDMRFSAILYEFIVIGEATKRLSADFRAEHLEIPWKDMAGMRDILAHHYDEIDVELLQKTIQESIPDLLRKLEKILPKKT